MKTTSSSKKYYFIEGESWLNIDLYVCVWMIEWRAWDLREKAPAKTFKSHTSWVSSIRGLESDSNVFLTTSYDHTVKIWDMRSSFPMFTLKTHHEKVLCGVWNSKIIFFGGRNTICRKKGINYFILFCVKIGNASIVTGGSDNEIVSHVFRADWMDTNLPNPELFLIFHTIFFTFQFIFVDKNNISFVK